MWKRIKSLTKLFLKTTFHFNPGKKKKKGSIILYALLFAYLIGIVIYGSYEAVDFLKGIQQEKAFAAIIIMANMLLALVVMLIGSLNVLYYSTDNLAVLPLPVKAGEIVAAKLNSLIAYEYIETALIGLLPLSVYGVLTGQSWIYYVLMIVVLAILPVIPVCISACLIIFLMSFTKGLRNKRLVQLFTMLLALGFSCSVSFISSSVRSEADVMAFFNQVNGLVEVYKSVLPNVSWAVSALLDRNILSLLILIAVSALIYVLSVLFSQKFYFKGVLSSLFSSGGIHKKKVDEKTSFKSQGLPLTYILKEFRIYLRRPTYLVQLLLPTLVVPVLMLVVFYFSAKQGMEGSGMSMDLFTEMIRGYEPIVFGCVVMVLLFNTMYSFLSVVAISKDGKDAAFMKTIPVPLWEQVLYKAVPDMLMVLFDSVVTILIVSFILKLRVLVIILLFLVMIPFSFFHGAFIYFDLRAPKLYWHNDLEIVKRNFRVMIPIAVHMVFIALVAILTFVAEMEMVPLAVLLTLVFSLLAFLSCLFLYKKADALAKAIY